MKTRSNRGKSKLKHVIADIFSAALVIEAAAPGKLSTVSGADKVKDLDLTKFALSSPAIHDVIIYSMNNALERKPLNLGKLTLHGIKRIMHNPLIGTNTALGYLMLSIPLSYIIGLTLKKGIDELRDVSTVITMHYTIIKEELKKEGIKDLYTAIRIASEGHLGKFVGAAPSINDNATQAKVSVWDALVSSTCYDIIAYDLTHGFRTTLLALNKLLTLAKKPDELLPAIPYLQAYLLSELPDTLVLKAWGLPTTLLLSRVAAAMKPCTGEWNSVSKALRNSGVNPGSTSDIMCAAIALYLVRNLAHSNNS